jgi:hypothetical protein
MRCRAICFLTCLLQEASPHFGALRIVLSRLEPAGGQKSSAELVACERTHFCRSVRRTGRNICRAGPRKRRRSTFSATRLREQRLVRRLRHHLQKLTSIGDKVHASITSISRVTLPRPSSTQPPVKEQCAGCSIQASRVLAHRLRSKLPKLPGVQSVSCVRCRFATHGTYFPFSSAIGHLDAFRGYKGVFGKQGLKHA